MAATLLDDLLDWLRIPSISTGGGRPEDLRRAAEWVLERVEAAGGVAELLTGDGHPIAYGELPASSRPSQAPTVLIYGHYDVQSTGDPGAWRVPPFDPEVRDGRVWARGASDDKGNFLPLLHAAVELARAGELPVNVRVLVEGEEEVGSASVNEWVRQDERGADAAIVFDAAMADERTPAITLGLRGMVSAQVSVRTARRDLHSGLYGGTVLNAAHVLHAMLAAVLPGPDGVVRPELRAGIEPPSGEELDSWRRLAPGAAVIAEAGGRAVAAGAAERFYERTGADASLDVNHLVTGDTRTVVPSTASATVSLRLAPSQRAGDIAPVLEELMRRAAPDGAEVRFDVFTAEPVLVAAGSPVIRLAAHALERATGTRPALVRSGGSIPVVGELARRRIPTVLSGFALADDDIHAPNESYRLESLRLGEAASRELLTALARLGS